MEGFNSKSGQKSRCQGLRQAKGLIAKWEREEIQVNLKSRWNIVQISVGRAIPKHWSPNRERSRTYRRLLTNHAQKNNICNSHASLISTYEIIHLRRLSGFGASWSRWRTKTLTLKTSKRIWTWQHRYWRRFIWMGAGRKIRKTVALCLWYCWTREKKCAKYEVNFIFRVCMDVCVCMSGSAWSPRTTSSSFSLMEFPQRLLIGWHQHSLRGSDSWSAGPTRSPNFVASCMRYRLGFLWRGIPLLFYFFVCS